MSFLELEGLHVFVTGAAGGIGSAIVEEFLGMLLCFICIYTTNASGIKIKADIIQLEVARSQRTTSVPTPSLPRQICTAYRATSAMNLPLKPRWPKPLTTSAP